MSLAARVLRRAAICGAAGLVAGGLLGAFLVNLDQAHEIQQLQVQVQQLEHRP